MSNNRDYQVEELGFEPFEKGFNQYEEAIAYAQAVAKWDWDLVRSDSPYFTYELQWAEPHVTVVQIHDTWNGYSQWRVYDCRRGETHGAILGYVTGDTAMDAHFNVHNGNMYEREN
jgi:hypothetical protein